MVFLGFDYRIMRHFLAEGLGLGFSGHWPRGVSEENLPKRLFSLSSDWLVSPIEACSG